MMVAGLLRRWRHNEGGATALEFGLVAMPFLAMILATFEVGYVHLEAELLAGAVTKASRAMLVGQTQVSGTVTTATQFVTNYLCPATGTRIIPSNFDCSKIVVDVRPITSFTTVDLTNSIYKSGATEFCPGNAGQIVLMRVVYPLPAILPLNLFSGSAGTVSDVPGNSGRFHILMGSALFQEEAFTGTYTPPAGC